MEIHSPGTLPNGLTIDDIVVGTSMPRNMFLFTNAIHLLPYTGAGSGMLRALSEDMNVSFSNNDRTNEFVITINRPRGNQVSKGSDQVGENSNQATEESNQVNGNLVTKLGHSDTNLDTNSDTFNTDSDTDLDSDSDTFNADSDTKRPKITNKQRDIVNFCSVPRSSKEILERAGVTYHSKNIQTYIMALVEAGYLEMTNPEHPNASNQNIGEIKIATYIYRKRALVFYVSILRYEKSFPSLIDGLLFVEYLLLDSTNQVSNCFRCFLAAHLQFGKEFLFCSIRIEKVH